MEKQTLTQSLWATLIGPDGREISDEWLDAGTQVQEEHRATALDQDYPVWFLAWHPDTGSGPYRYRTTISRWRQAQAS